MSFLAIAVCIASATSAGCTNDTRVATDPRGDLGKPCSTDADCRGALYCASSDPIFGLCTRSCSDTDDCQLEYGLGSFCIGANLCVRECVRDTDCLQRTACDSEYSWCR